MIYNLWRDFKFLELYISSFFNEIALIIYNNCNCEQRGPLLIPLKMASTSVLSNNNQVEKLHTQAQKDSTNHDNSSDSSVFEDINIISLISRAKFPVYLVYSPIRNQSFALKFFPFENKKPHQFYLNEARFSFLNHPNVIKILHSENETSVASGGSDKQVSCILSEYAPHGDLFQFVKKFKTNITEKIVRTYFRQLIDGIEYLHSQGVCHLDLKLENILVGEGYQLKVADFDLSYKSGDSKILTKGSRFYRAPELKAAQCTNGPAADIYAAGIILFVLRCGGIIPHTEEGVSEEVDLYSLLENDPKAFFKEHCMIQEKKSSFFDSNFKELFTSMVKQNPKDRITIEKIKKTKWYKGSVYSKEDLTKNVQKLFSN